MPEFGNEKGCGEQITVRVGATGDEVYEELATKIRKLWSFEK